MEAGKHNFINSCSCWLWFTVVISISGCTRWAPSKIEETKMNGDEIIVAIYRYHKTHHQLPPNLKSLTPDYIDAIPEPKVGNKKWRYSYSSEGTTSFKLSVEDDLNVSSSSLFYYSERSKWEVDIE